MLLFCNNLGAHVRDDIRKSFGDNKVFFCYFPPGMTNFIQSIDAGLGRSVRIYVGNFMDKWLMIEENMERWESKWTAAERRIMISKWVGNAMQFVMQPNNDSACIGAFERTGCLLTWIPNDTHDLKIRPQGMPVGKFSIPTQPRAEINSPQVVPAPQNEEDAALREEQAIIDEQENTEFTLVMNEESDEPDDDSDNGE